MEFEDRNPRPEEGNKSLPVVVLFALIGIICLLLYAGWYMLGNNTSDASDLTKDEPTKTTEPIKDSIMVDAEDVKAETATTEATAENKSEETEKAKEKEVEKETAKEEAKETVAEKSSSETTSITVKEGQTFLGIANKYNLSFSELKAANKGLNTDALVVGKTKVVVPINTIHTVGPGDILKVVAKKYNITVDQLMAANGKTKNFAERGEKLIIPKKK
jgi:LysM repeat protein